MDWIVKTFQQYPELAIFVTLALGYWVGNIKFGKFNLGAVTGVLLAGVLIGQMQITIFPNYDCASQVKCGSNANKLRNFYYVL
jgi:putative transport protein